MSNRRIGTLQQRAPVRTVGQNQPGVRTLGQGAVRQGTGPVVTSSLVQSQWLDSQKPNQARRAAPVVTGGVRTQAGVRTVAQPSTQVRSSRVGAQPTTQLRSSRTYAQPSTQVRSSRVVAQPSTQVRSSRMIAQPTTGFRTSQVRPVSQPGIVRSSHTRPTYQQAPVVRQSPQVRTTVGAQPQRNYTPGRSTVTTAPVQRQQPVASRTTPHQPQRNYTPGRSTVTTGPVQQQQPVDTRRTHVKSAPRRSAPPLQRTIPGQDFHNYSQVYCLADNRRRKKNSWKESQLNTQKKDVCNLI
eukprot:NODE_2122_length_981_cov_118.430258_g1738_i0.p1 GENE.NODE_2122_length_981_cov_118.430258_g1738_i0~~NODE_2122_length_981_cov_118.430258_g1738_i0.p1  ORF type:complete len:298 (-),score=-30.39 NODE_2122_length_981_cov_118.430258_g1738_i0:42-935(-)